MRRSVRITAAFVLLTLGAGRAPAADAVADLLGWVPAGANAALFIDADAVRKSDLAVKEKWGTRNDPTLGLDSLPPNVAKLVVASQLDPASGMAWEVLVASQKRPATEADLLKKFGGTRDTIAGKSVILTPRHGIAATLAPGVAGSYQPPNRQEAGRWLRGATGKLAPDFSPFLKQAAASVGPNAPVVLAFDTADMFDPAGLKARLEKADSLKGKAATPDALAGLFATTRGVTLTIRVTDGLTGELRIDFDRPADPLKDVAKPLLLEALQRLGVHGDEMDAWTATVRGNAVTFGGPLTQPTADNLLAPFLRPNASALDADETSPPGGDPKTDPKVAASQKYFQAVSKKIKETRASKNTNTFPKLAYTLNTAARQIDDLPMLNVDEELLDWGAGVATTLRTMALMAQVTGGQISLLEANKAMVSVSTPNYYYGFGYGAAAGPYGGAAYGYNYAVPSGTTSTGVVSNYGAVGNIQTMTNQKEFQYRIDTWNNIEKVTSEVRRKMVKKYNAEF